MGTGLVLVALPPLLAALLLGSSVDAPAALTVGHVAGAALLAIGVACWPARYDGQSRAAKRAGRHVGALQRCHPHGPRVCGHRLRAVQQRPLAKRIGSRGHDRLVRHKSSEEPSLMAPGRRQPVQTLA